jgi:regulator of sirC expression with transglutaminase-like and TPR domain
MTVAPTANSDAGATGASLLERAASLLTDAYPREDPDVVVQTVRDWGQRLASRLSPDISTLHRLRMLHHYYFDELGFRGNAEAYEDVDNSYLNCVVDRRTGIPISLSVVYADIGQRIGLKLAGVGFPGHFLVRLSFATGPAVIDVFGGGAVLSEQELRERLRAAVGGEAPHPLYAYLRPATDDEVIVRWLRNLLSLHVGRGNWSQVLKVTNRLIAVAPSAAEERLLRAQAYERFECPRAAADDLAQFLALRPQSPDAPSVRATLQRLRSTSRTLH